jgi:hypothetical protein
VFYAIGANETLRTESARAVGGFTNRRGAGEEESIAVPLRAKYGKDTVQYFPELLMLHDFGVHLDDSFRRARSYGRSHGRDWVLDGGIPTIQPVAVVLVLGSLLAALIGPLLAALGLAVGPLVTYRARTAQPWHRERLAYPFVRLVEDLADNLGFVEGMLSARRDRTS